jgi:glyoxylase-like metal-dependent hydrolase (beta-lactamase superfamily II)
MPVGPMANYVYLIGCEATKEAAVVDPAWDADGIIAAAERAGYRITTVFATHHHFDHVNAAAALAEKTGATKYANTHELSTLNSADASTSSSGSPRIGLRPERVEGGWGADSGEGNGWTAVEDNQRVAVGNVSVTCLHTPGHTPGSQCLLVEGRLITGDTLFVGNIGRCDLPGSSPADLYNSLMRLKALPPETIVLPGHNYGATPSSTIVEQAQQNMYLRIPSLEAFLHVMGQ